MECANSRPCWGELRNAMAEIPRSHHKPNSLVGAAGFEPTTSLEFEQGALTAELYAYRVWTYSYTDGTHRMSRGPRTLVQANGIFFHNATGS